MGGIDLSRPAGERLQWMDLLRGMSILLVLLWHAMAVPVLFDWPVQPWLTAVNNFFLPFRMPTLMFLSGLLLPRALTKTRLAYYVGKVRTLVWPYFLWAAVFLAQYGSPAPLYHWRSWYAVGYLWFLFFIATYYFFAPLITKLPAWLTPWLFMLASIPLPAGVNKRMLYFATFFFLGYWFATSPRLRSMVKGAVIPVVALVAVAWGVASAIWGVTLAYRGEFGLFSICGILTAIWLAQRAKGRWTRPIAFVGRNSIVYYVCHFPVMTLIVMATLALRLTPDPSIWIPNLIAGVAVGTLLALARPNPWVAWLFELPPVLTRAILHVGTPPRAAVEPEAPHPERGDA